jgi:hypothetical protein
LFGAEIWILRKIDHKCLEKFKMWFCRRMEEISWTDRVENAEVLHRIKEKRNILHAIKERKANYIGHSLRRNRLIKHIIEGKIEGTGRRGRGRKQLLDDHKENKRYWNLKENALCRIIWRTRFGRDHGPVARQTT